MTAKGMRKKKKVSYFLFPLSFVARVLDEKAIAKQSKKRKEIDCEAKRVNEKYWQQKSQRQRKRQQETKASKLNKKELKCSNRRSWSSAGFGGHFLQ